jgi:hypothetical protein
MSGPFDRLFNATQRAAIAALGAWQKLCIRIDADSPLRYCTGELEFNPSEVDVSLEDALYVPRSIRMSSVSIQGAGTLTLGNADLVLSTLDLSGGNLSDVEVRVMEFHRNLLGRWTHARTRYFWSGQLSWDAQEFQISLKHWGRKRRKGALATESVSCSNLYGDPDCGHSGNPCDYTRDSCIARGNLQHFSGHILARKDGEQIPIYAGHSAMVGNPGGIQLPPDSGNGNQGGDGLTLPNFGITDGFGVGNPWGPGSDSPTGPSGDTGAESGSGSSM